MTDVVKFIYSLARYLNSYVATVIVVIGIVLNLFSIYIFRKGDKGRSTPAVHYYLTALLLWESGVLANILLHALPVFIWGRPLPFGSYLPIYLGNIYFTIASSTAVVWVLVALTVDRYLALCHPMKHRTMSSRRYSVKKGDKSMKCSLSCKAKKTMVAISIAALLFAIPQLFEITVREDCSLNSVNETICATTPEHTALAKNTLYWAVYRVLLNFLFVSAVPCVLLCALTIRISVALSREFKERHHLLAHSTWNNQVDAKLRNKELKSNLLLVITIAKSNISSVQPTLFAILRLIYGENFRGPYVGIWYYLNDFITELDYASNFIVFIIFGRMFRLTCKDILSSSFLGHILRIRTAELGSEASGHTKTTRLQERHSTQEVQHVNRCEGRRVFSQD